MLYRLRPVHCVATIISELLKVAIWRIFSSHLILSLPACDRCRNLSRLHDRIVHLRAHCQLLVAYTTCRIDIIRCSDWRSDYSRHRIACGFMIALQDMCYVTCLGCWIVRVTCAHVQSLVSNTRHAQSLSLAWPPSVVR